MHHEVGFLKVKPETSSLAFIIAQNTGRHVILSLYSAQQSHQVVTGPCLICKTDYNHNEQTCEGEGGKLGRR